MNRHEYFGGSDAGAVLGYNMYRPPYMVWWEKKHKIDRDLSFGDIDRGNAMEPIVEQWIRENMAPDLNSDQIFAKYDHEGKKGGSVTGTDNQIMLVDDKCSYIGGHPDGISSGILWEIKAPRQNTVEQYYKRGLPLRYIMQVQHYLMITGLPLGKIVVWDYDKWGQPLIFDVHPDEGVHAALRDAYALIYNSLLLDDMPTDLNSFQAPKEAHEMEELFMKYLAAKDLRYKNEKREKEAKAEILAKLQKGDVYMSDRYVVNVSDVDAGSYSYTRLIVKDTLEGLSDS